MRLLIHLVVALTAIFLAAEANAKESLWVFHDHPDLCRSTSEFEKAVLFLRNQPEISGNEAAAREIAFKIAGNCTGAFDRFSKTFLLLRKSGVNPYKSLEIATDFSSEKDETINNFYEIFQKTYLTEHLNLDFATALEISYSLSKNYVGDPVQAREDFMNLTAFCLEEENMALGIVPCAKFAVELAKLAQYFPEGTYRPFRKVYRILRRDESFGISIQEAINNIAKIFKYGPKAPDNFMDAFEFAMSKKGLHLKANEALAFAHKMAELSTKTNPPPLYIKPKDAKAAATTKSEEPEKKEE